MKTTIAALALVLTFSTTAFSAEGLIYSVRTNEITTFKKVTKTKFQMLSQVATGVARLDNGDSNVFSRDINEADVQNDLSIDITGKSTLKVVDVREKINREIPATISLSMLGLGSVKRVKIDAKTMDALYSASIKRAGLNYFKGIKIFGGILNSSVAVTDLNCEVDGDLLICKQDTLLQIF